MRLTFTLFVLLLSISCLAQEGRDTLKSNINNPEERFIFFSSQKVPYVHLPDSLAGSDVTGVATLELYVNNRSGVDSFHIVKLKLASNSKSLIDYNRGVTAEGDLKRYYQFMNEYINVYMTIYPVTDNRYQIPKPLNVYLNF